MSLTPRSDDPNRRSELERKKEQPFTFDSGGIDLEFRYTGLIDLRGRPLIDDPRKHLDKTKYEEKK